MKHLDTSYRITEGVDKVFRVEYKHQSGNTVTLVQYKSLDEATSYVKNEIAKASKMMKDKSKTASAAKVVVDWKDNFGATNKSKTQE